MKLLKATTVYLAAAIWLAAVPSVHAQWSQNSGPGPSDYTNTANWYGGVVNNLFTNAPISGLNITFSTDWTLSSQLTMTWSGNSNVTFCSDSATPRTIKLSGGGIIKTNNQGGIVTLGTIANPLILDLNGGTRHLGGYQQLGTADGTNNVYAQVIDSSGKTNGVNLSGSRIYTYLLNDNNSFVGAVTFTNLRGGGFTSIKNIGAGPSAMGAPTDSTNGTVTVLDNTSFGTIAYLGAGDTTDRPFNWRLTGSAYAFENRGSGKITFTGPWTLPHEPSRTNIFTINALASHIELDGYLKGVGSTLTNLVFKAGTNSNQIILTCATNDFSALLATNCTLIFSSLANAGQPCALGTGTNLVLGSDPTHSAILVYSGTNNATSDRTLVLQAPANSGASFSLLNNSTNNRSLRLSNTNAWVLSPNISNCVATLGGTATGVSIIDNLISNPPLGSLSLIVSGSLWQLNAANTFTGGTTISNATLIVNNSSGSATGPGQVSVSAGGILAGAGRLSGTVAVGGSISPGYGNISTLSSGPILFNAGAHYTWSLDNATGSEGAESGWDLLNVQGTATNASTLANPLTIDVNSLATNGLPGSALNFDPASAYAWRILKSAAPLVGFSTSTVVVNTAGLSNSIVNGSGNGAFTLATANTNQDLLLTFTGYPAITAGPFDASALPGTTAVFSVTATGGSLTYQWEKNGTDIPGATTASLTLTNVQSSDQAIYDVVLSNLAGVVTSPGAVLKLSDSQTNQTITFGALTNKNYGDPPFALSATASSGLPVSYTVTAGPASISNNLLSITGAGSVTVRADQPGNDSFSPAPPVSQTFAVYPQALTVTADNKTRGYGATNPPFTVGFSGFVNGDTADDLSGAPLLATAATPASPLGTYAITVTNGTLASANYTFTFVSGTLTVVPSYFYPAGNTFAFTFYSTRTNDSAYVLTNGATGLGPYYGDQSAPLGAAASLNSRYIYKVTPPCMAGLGASDFDNTNFVWPSDATITGQVAAIITSVQSNGNIVMWDFEPEELRPWKPMELHYFNIVSATIRGSDAYHRPLYNYQPNNRDDATLATIVGQENICTKGMYVGTITDDLGNSCMTNRIWARWSMEQELGAVAAANTSAAPWIHLWMAADPPAGYASMINDWCRHDAYMGLIMGGKGIEIWSGFQGRAGFADTNFYAYLNGYLSVAKDLNGPLGLAPVFLYGQKQTNVAINVTAGPSTLTLAYQGTTNYPPITCLDKVYNGSNYLFMVNSAEQSVTATFSGLPAQNRTDLFAGGSTATPGGSFAITLPSHAVKAFRFDVLPVTVPVIVADPPLLLAESCTPTNNAIDPGESVVLSFPLKNTGGVPGSNVVATLLSGGGVSSPSGPQSYGSLATGGVAVARSFSFAASGVCGGALLTVLQVTDGTNALGYFTNIFTLGLPGTVLTEAFDGVTAPTLPTGWTTWKGGAQSNWVTTTASKYSAPNAVFSPDVSGVGSNALVSPLIYISSTNAQLSFRNYYNLESGYDGGVLEIKVGTNNWKDILTAGGSFTSGGYNKTLNTRYGNPIGGRQAWSGNSGGFTNTIARLPVAAGGQTNQLRWLCGTDNSQSGAGWYIDSISLTDRVCSACASGPVTVVLTSPTNGAVFTFPTAIDLAADVSSNGHTLAKVQFLCGTNLLGEDLAAPFTWHWTNAGAGSYALSALAFYDSGTVTSAVATVRVWDPTPPALGGAVAGTNFTLQVSGVPGQHYRVEYQSSLPPAGPWQVLADIASLPTSPHSIPDLITNAERFYRVVSLPGP